MVWIINQRTAGQAGAIAAAACWDVTPGPTPTYAVVTPAALDARTAGREVIIAIHGFNLSRPKAVRAYATLERMLALTDDQVFLGVCWPGDGWAPVVNYPWEASDARKCGDLLAAWLTTAIPRAQSFSFVSHSLGGRLLLQAVRSLARPAGEVCITAGAVDDDALVKEFAALKDKARRVSVLTSRRDKVLLGAYPLGDLISDLFLGDKHSPWHGALGFYGPNPAGAPGNMTHRPIPKALGYDHGDYFPPTDGSAAAGKWQAAAAYMRRAINGEPDIWP